jgi:hypothetical protein
MLRDTTVVAFRQPEIIEDPLTKLAREGPRRLVAQALIAEADAFVAAWKDLKLPDGRDRVLRHGHGPQRAIQTGVGPVEARRAKCATAARWLPRRRYASPRRSCRNGHGGPKSLDAAEAAIDVFADKSRPRYDKAVACLTKDREALLAFYDFPAEHWTTCHLEPDRERVRHRTSSNRADQGSALTEDCKAHGLPARHRRRQIVAVMKGENQLPKVVQGVKFQNGIEVTEMPAHHAA